MTLHYFNRYHKLQKSSHTINITTESYINRADMTETNILIKTWSLALNRRFSKEHIQLEIYGKCPKSLITREMQMKTKRIFSLLCHSVAVAAIRKTEDYKSWQRCGEKRPFTYCW
jgi:hypothetical protein